MQKTRIECQLLEQALHMPQLKSVMIGKDSKMWVVLHNLYNMNKEVQEVRSKLK